MLNNNSSNKFNTQNTENNDLYVEDIYKDLYPTDNENQNIEELNNKNIDINEPLDSKQLKKQQKALKKAQKEEENVRN